MATFDATPGVPSLVEPDDQDRAGAYASLNQLAQFFAPLTDIPAVYKDYIATQIALGGTGGTGTLPDLTVTDRFTTAPGAVVGFGGADGSTPPLPISGDRNNPAQVNASIISLLVALGLAVDRTTNSGTGTTIDGGTPADTVLALAYDGGAPTDLPTRFFDGGTP